MLTFTRRSLLLTTVTLLGSRGIADEQTTSSEPVADDLTPGVGDATLGGRLISASLLDRDGQEIGEIVDLMIDPYYARLSCLVIAPATATARKKRLLVPVELVECDGERATASRNISAIASSATSLLPGGKPTPYTRRMALAAYHHLELRPYWTRVVGERHASTNGSSKRDDLFFLFTTLREQSVTDSGGEKLGHIADLAFSDDGKIRYALLKHQHTDEGKESTRTFPVPLAAFVVPAGTGTWSIDLPEKLLKTMPVVKNGELPREISRGWVEYIHVKYGGNVFDGVQRSVKP